MWRAVFPGVVAVAFAAVLFGGGAGVARGQAAEKPKETTPIEREWKQIRLALVTGDYQKAYEREAVAEALVKLEPVAGGGKLIAETTNNLLRAEIHSAMGYFAAAKTSLNQSLDALTRYIVDPLRKGVAPEVLFSPFLRLGYGRLCQGDNALLQESVDSIVAQRAMKNTAKQHYDKGVDVIRQIVERKPELEKHPTVRNLLTRCHLRMARSAALSGDAVGAEGDFRTAEKGLRSDPRWQVQFDPSGEAAKAIPGQQPGAAVVDPADEALDLAEVALLYIEMLNVECEIHLAADPPRVPEAEAAASRARDIAEERFPRTAVYWHSLVNLARAYCAGNEIQLMKAAKDPNNVVQIDGQVVNVNAKAAETYRLDVEELVAKAEQASKDLNAARPIHFQIHAVKRKLAEDRKDGPALRKLDEELKKLVEQRNADKKPPAKRT